MDKGTEELKDEQIEAMIETVEGIRRVNNSYWMQILRIALREAPEETREVLQNVISLDKSVTEIMEMVVEH